VFRFVVLGSTLFLAACSPQSTGGAESSGNPWVVTEDGVAAARIGTARSELVTQGGAALGDVSGCEFIRPAGAPEGLAAMVVDGTVKRVDVIQPGIPTAAGVEVGDTTEELNRAYPWAGTRLPHKYVAGGHYVVVDVLDSPGGPRRFVFETVEDGTIVRYRVGVVPQVDWVEGCS
jgi:hypothetical protein